MRQVAVSLAIDRGTALEPGKKPPHGFLKDVADRYCGGKDFASDTIRQMAGVVVKLSTVVIEAIGDIVNEESPEIAKQALIRKNKRRKAQYINGRPFRKTINTFTLRGATKFLSAPNDADRVNALYRVKYLAHEYNYKGTPREILEQQLERAIAARTEAEKFEKMLGSDEWPQGMKVFQMNLLRTTKLDTEVERNDGNDVILLPSAEKLYKELYHSSALQNVQAWSRSFQSSQDYQSASSPEHALSSNEQEENETGQENEQQQEPANVQGCGSQEGDSVPNELSNPPELLVDPCSDVGIEALQMKFTAYDVQCFGDSVTPFDFIIGDPNMSGCSPGEPAKSKVVIDDKTMDEFAQFACRVLGRGGYLFLFTSLDYYKNWEQALVQRGFDVMPNAFVIVRNSKDVQSNNSRKWPQNISEIGIVAQAPGDHPSDFKVDLETPYNNSHKRKFAAITEVPSTVAKLAKPNRRSLVRANERAPQLISELITTFCPPGGRVLDPFANVFTTGIAYLATERPCTLLETDAECYDFAKKRLDVLAKCYGRERASSRATRSKKRNRAMTSPEELESLNRVLQQMESASLEDYCMVDE